MAMWPLSTSVNFSRTPASFGAPTATVRVTSVVPSSYWAPESIRKMSPAAMRRLLLRLTR
jgi:hypothetical protein